MSNKVVLQINTWTLLHRLNINFLPLLFSETIIDESEFKRPEVVLKYILRVQLNN